MPEGMDFSHHGSEIRLGYFVQVGSKNDEAADPSPFIF